jgi:hypothetical protein
MGGIREEEGKKGKIIALLHNYLCKSMFSLSWMTC